MHGSRLTAFKLPSTPHNPAEAILAGVEHALREISEWTHQQAQSLDIVHGTTVATNALLERKGARTALIITEGFEDVIEIGRQARPQLYNLMVTRPAPIVPRQLRLGVRERIAHDGSVVTPIDHGQLNKVIEKMKRLGAESVAVCLLFSFANPEHERRVALALELLGIPVSLSHKILPEYREYERTSTVAINAYLVPTWSRYLRSLAEGLKKQAACSRLRIMQSSGGSVSAETAAAEPVRAILSGPAGGVIGALHISALIGIRNIITFDMGGTSTDVALCRGQARTTNEAVVAGLPIAVPVIDIHTVGAGGWSIAHVDQAGALRVGPESAGADPGPACYGLGEEVTVTDANLVLGRFGDASLLGGQMKLDVERAKYFLTELAKDISRFSAKRVTAEHAALGVIRVANANMEQALRAVSIERGQDPRLLTLVSFGGAGGLHVCELAAALGITRIVVPRSPGTLSALGVLLGDAVRDYSRTVMVNTKGLDLKAIEREFAALEREASHDLVVEGLREDRIRLARSVAMRYVGQSFEIEVAWSRRFESTFHAAHQQRYGYSDRLWPTEIVSIRVRAIGVTDKPRLQRLRLCRPYKPKPSFIASVYLTERPPPTPVYSREQLSAGASLTGPAIITEYSSTTLIPPSRKVQVDPYLNLLISDLHNR
jgi:N-methylhydantoinase A